MKISNWQILKSFFCERITRPFGQPSYTFYFLIIIVLIGSIGIFYELLISTQSCHINIENLTLSAANIFIALIASSTVELLLIQEENLKYPHRKNDIQILGLSFLIIGFLLWILANYLMHENAGLILSLVGLGLSYFVWWIANSDNKKIAPSSKPFVTIGGENPANSLNLKGDTSEFKTE
jgi:hypothetical protein